MVTVACAEKGRRVREESCQGTPEVHVRIDKFLPNSSAADRPEPPINRFNTKHGYDATLV